MAIRLPLSALLSHLLVAFTVEFDNEAEHRLPHRTTGFGSTTGVLPAPWLVSMAMWFNCLQHVGAGGIGVGELFAAARTETNLAGMQRWRYITLTPDAADKRPKPPRSAWVIRATAGGRRAQEIWRPLFAEIEQRWEKRFGSGEVETLREALTGIAAQSADNLPDTLPILGYGLWSNGKASKLRLPRAPQDAPNRAVLAQLPLPALLARVLLAYAIEFESTATVSLAIHANFLRLLDEKPKLLRDLPELSGVSKELTSVGVGYLQRHGYALLDPAPAPQRGKAVRLNEKGLLTQDACRRLNSAIEKRWHSRVGEAAVLRLQTRLETFAGDGTAAGSPLFAGLEPYPGGWRAATRRPVTLPHYPLISHRGGFPDGS